MASKYKKWPCKIVFAEFEIPKERVIYAKDNKFDWIVMDKEGINWNKTDKSSGKITYLVDMNRTNLNYIAYTGCMLSNSLYDNRLKVTTLLETLRNKIIEHNRVSIRTLSNHLNILKDNELIDSKHIIYAHDEWGPNEYTFYDFMDEYIIMLEKIYNHPKLNSSDIIYYARLKAISKWTDGSFIICKKQSEICELVKISESHFKKLRKKFVNLGLIEAKRQNKRGLQKIKLTLEHDNYREITREEIIKQTIHANRGVESETTVII